ANWRRDTTLGILRSVPVDLRSSDSGSHAARLPTPNFTPMRSRLPRAAFAAAASFWVLTACSSADGRSGTGPSGVVDDEALRNAGERVGEWLTYGGDYAETRFSRLDQIHAGNVAELGLAWSFATDTDRGLEATPLVVDDVIYTTGSWST